MTRSPRGQHPGESHLGGGLPRVLAMSSRGWEEGNVAGDVFPAENRGLFARQSSGAMRSRPVTAPVKKPQPSGLNGTKAMPNSSQAGITFDSGSRVQREYSD